MPDLTMCKGNSCSLKNECYRYRAIPSKHLQSWFVTPPHYLDTQVNKENSLLKVTHKCDHHIPLDGRTRILSIEEIEKDNENVES